MMDKTLELVMSNSDMAELFVGYSIAANEKSIEGETYQFFQYLEDTLEMASGKVITEDEIEMRKEELALFYEEETIEEIIKAWTEGKSYYDVLMGY